MSRYCSRAKFYVSQNLCAMFDILEKSLIILKWNERDRACPFIIWKTQQKFLVLLAHEVKTKIKYFIFGFNTYN